MATDANQEPLLVAYAADIKQLYDAYAQLPKPDPTAAHPIPVFPNPEDAPEGALPAALEFDGLHGRIIAPLEAVPSETLQNHPEVLALKDGLHTIQLSEQDDGNWQLYLQGSDIHTGVRFALAKEELTTILARDNVTLPGRPSDEELAAIKAPAQAPIQTEDIDAPPF